jgi:soluble lytic murein transglycosylase-like protein
MREREMRWWLVFGTIVIVVSIPALGVAKGGKQTMRTQVEGGSHPFHACLEEAATAYQLPSTLLRAIVQVENGNWDPLAVSVNQHGKGIRQTVRSMNDAISLVTRLWKQNVNFDVGLGQVNTRNMERFRIHPIALLDGCSNLEVSARILRESIERHGYNWRAIERYNGINPQYPWRVKKALDQLR